MTYTEHKLTDYQLRVLEQIVSDYERRHAALPTLMVLLRKRLIQRHLPEFEHEFYPVNAAKNALAQARAEGW